MVSAARRHGSASSTSSTSFASSFALSYSVSLRLSGERGRRISRMPSGGV